MKEEGKDTITQTDIFRRVIEASRAGIVVLQNGVIKFANKSACLLLGSFEVVNKPVVRFIHPDSLENFIELYKKSIESKKEVFSEIAIKRESGDVFVEITAIPLSESTIILLLQDVTVEKTAETELKEVKKFQEAIFNELPVSMAICNRDLKIINANRTFESLIGGEVSGRELYDLISEGDYEAMMEFAERLVNDSLKEFPVRLKCSDGEREVKVSSSKLVTDGFEGYIFIFDASHDYLQLLPDAVLMCDDGIIFANPAACSLFGVGSEDITGKSLLDFVSAEIQKVLFEWCKEVRNSRSPLSIELPFTLPDGSERFFELKGCAAGRKVLIVLRDVTDRKKLEEELRESRDEFVSLAENSIVGVFIIQDGVLKYVNPALAAMGRYKREEMTGRNPLDFIHPGDIPEVAEKMEKRLKGEDVTGRYIARALTKDGKVKFLEFFASKVNISGKPAIIGVAVDVTETEMVRNRFRSLFESAPDIICLLDEDGRVVEINRDAFGYKKEEIEGESFWNFCVDGDRIIEMLSDLQYNQSTRFVAEVEEKDGRRVEYECAVSRMPDGWVVVVRDITEKRELSKSLNETVEVLKLLNRMMRHDVLNNLNVVLLALESVEVKGKDKKMVKHALNSVEKSIRLIERARELEKMLFSRKGLKKVRVIEVVEEVAKRHPEVEVNVTGDLNVLADEAFESVVDNIISNSKIHGKASKVDVEMFESGDWCVIKFKDNGKGIPDEIKDKVFQEGFIAGETGHTGLGLFIVRQVIGRYGGEVWVEDNFPKGAVISMKLRKA